MSSNKELVSYLYTRFPATRFIPLAIFLAAAGLASSSPAHLLPWVLAVALALTLILQFRLWDDIADRDHDQRTHPERVLCHTQNIKPFLTVTGILFVFNGLVLFWLHDSGFKPIGYLVLCVYLLAWYRLRPITTPVNLLNSHLVMLKYPVIAWLVGTSAADPDMILLLSCLFSVYLIFIIFEILDDHGLRRLPGAIVSLMASFSFLICVWVFIAFWNRPHTNSAFVAIWTLIVLSTLVLGLFGFLKLKRHSVTRNGRGFFIVGLLAYLAVAVEKSA